MKWEQVSHLEKLVIEIVRNINVNSLTKEQKRLIVIFFSTPFLKEIVKMGMFGTTSRLTL